MPQSVWNLGMLTNCVKRGRGGIWNIWHSDPLLENFSVNFLTMILEYFTVNKLLSSALWLGANFIVWRLIWEPHNHIAFMGQHMPSVKENTGKWTVDHCDLSLLNSKGIGRGVIHNDSKGLEEENIRCWNFFRISI